LTAKTELYQNDVSIGQADTEINKQATIGGYSIAISSATPAIHHTKDKTSDYTINFILAK